MGIVKGGYMLGKFLASSPKSAAALHAAKVAAHKANVAFLIEHSQEIVAIKAPVYKAAVVGAKVAAAAKVAIGGAIMAGLGWWCDWH